MFARMKLNDGGGDLYKRWSMCFNLILRNESYPITSLMLFDYFKFILNYVY